MSHLINPLVADTGTPPIPEARGWLGAYDGRHGPAIDLSQAAPGSAPPDELLAHSAAGTGLAENAKYGPIHGEMNLRNALAADVARIYGAQVDAADVAITAGCNQAFVISMMTIAKSGDAVILPAPWYFNHQMTLHMLGVRVIALPTLPGAGFLPDVLAARALIDESVRAIVLVTPNNPTGAVYPPALISAFADLAREHAIALVLDETYRDFMPEGHERPHGALARADWRSHVIQLYSFSKAYAIPGWRLGAVVADAALQDQMGKVADCLQICPVRAGQHAVAWGIDGIRGWRDGNREDINSRAAVFKAAMRGLNGWSVDQAGAYFAYVRHPFGDAPSAQVSEMLARRWGVLALPGSYFGPGQEGHLRMAFANAAPAVIADAVARLAQSARQ